MFKKLLPEIQLESEYLRNYRKYLQIQIFGFSFTEDLRRIKPRKKYARHSKYQTARKLVSEHIILNSCDVDLTVYECPAEFFLGQMTDREIENLAKSVSSTNNEFYLTGEENIRQKALSYWKNICTTNSVFQKIVDHCKF